jgi:hypothetical protein
MEQFVWALAMSAHVGLEGDYNQFHPHVRFIDDGAIAGAYYNSMERITFYGGYRLEPTENLGLEFALATGYNEFGPVAPYMRTTYDLGDRTRLFASSAFEKNSDDVNLGAVVGVEFIIK